MNIQSTKNFVLTHHLEERSFSGFWNYFKNYQEECSEEFQKEFPEYNDSHVELFIDSVSLRITNWPEDGYNHMVVEVRIHYKNKYAGMYGITYSLTGEVEDDHLSLD